MIDQPASLGRTAPFTLDESSLRSQVIAAASSSAEAGCGTFVCMYGPMRSPANAERNSAWMFVTVTGLVTGLALVPIVHRGYPLCRGNELGVFAVRGRRRQASPLLAETFRRSRATIEVARRRR